MQVAFKADFVGGLKELYIDAGGERPFEREAPNFQPALKRSHDTNGECNLPYEFVDCGDFNGVALIAARDRKFESIAEFSVLLIANSRCQRDFNASDIGRR